jgi:hypothetical protein
MKNSEVFSFIGKCLVMDDDPDARESVTEAVHMNQVPWEILVSVGSSNLVLPALFSSFSRHGILPLLPEELSEHLCAAYDLNRYRNQRIIRQTEKISKLLNKQKIPFITMKGTSHLLQGLYYDMADRIFIDIDLLVSSSSDMTKAAEIMMQNGYIAVAGFYPEEVNDMKHYPRLKKDGEVASVEIHQQIFIEKYSGILNMEMAFRDKVCSPEDGYNFLSTEHQLVLNFVHGQLNDRGLLYGSTSLKSMYDFYLLAKKQSPGIRDIRLPRYGKEWNAYVRLTSETFCRPSFLPFEDTLYSKKVLIRKTFYLNYTRKAVSRNKAIRKYLRLSYLITLILKGFVSVSTRKYIQRRLSVPSFLFRKRQHPEDMVKEMLP